MTKGSRAQRHQFSTVFNGVYKGAAPWITAMGNHDWGGRVFTNGWDQQIAYTWHSTRWVLPAVYWMTTAHFPDAGFSVDMFFLDTNVFDAHDPPKDSEHNICGSAHNPPGATCAEIGGPESVSSCPGWFHRLWSEEKKWLYEKM